MTELIGYARVSTDGQDPQLQIDALKAAGVDKANIYIDIASGALDGRPELTKLLDYVRAGDTLVVWKLDRLGRSLKHLVAQMTLLEEREIGFRSLTEGIDTTTSAGRLVFGIFGSLAQFERDLIAERTKAGLAAARARGRSGGAPTIMTETKIRTAREMYEAKGDDGKRKNTVQEIADTIGVSRMTVYRHLDTSNTKAEQLANMTDS